MQGACFFGTLSVYVLKPDTEFWFGNAFVLVVYYHSAHRVEYLLEGARALAQCAQGRRVVVFGDAFYQHRWASRDLLSVYGREAQVRGSLQQEITFQ